MSKIESSRKDLKINGYVHPTEIVAKQTGKYKTFDTENKNEDYVSAVHRSTYATFTDKDYTDNYNKICPECGDAALYECECKLKDRQCSKGHVWYIDKSGFIKKGDPHDN